MSVEAEQSNNTTFSQSEYRRITTIKTSLNGIGWKENYRATLNEFVCSVNDLVTHGFAFAKFIFLKEFNKDGEFDFNKYVTKAFFQEVLLALVDRKTKEGRLAEKTRDIRQLINTYKDEYIQVSSYIPITLTNAQQIALYEGTKIHTVYINNVAQHFGNRLRMFLNLISNKKEKIENMTQEMKSKGFTDEEIKSSVRTHITNVCTQLKLNVSAKKFPDIPANFLDKKALEQLQQFLDVYPEHYKFKKDSIYYDVKSSPQNHLRAFYTLAKLCEERKNKSFTCFPLQTSFVPCYVTIDAKILNYHILKRKSFPVGQKHELWKQVINYDCKAIKCSTTMNFEGTLDTDGVGVSLLKQNFSPDRRGTLNVERKPLKADNDEFRYLESLSKKELDNTLKKCVLIDPGRHDLLFCMHEDSSIEEKKLFRFTRNQKLVETKARRFNKLRKFMKPAYIQELEASLSKIPAATVDLVKYTKYIKRRSKVSQPLKRYYSSEGEFLDRNIGYVYEDSDEDDPAIGIDDTAAATDNICPKPAFECKKSKNKLGTYLSNLRYIHQENNTQIQLAEDDITQLNTVIQQTDEILQKPETTEEGFESQISIVKNLLEETKAKLPTLKFRKMKLQSTINRQQSEKRLANALKAKFGEDAVLVLGNWSASHVKFHEPTKGKGMRKMLRHEGFEVLLIDEFNTSSICPECNSDLKKFKTIENPRPYRRSKMLEVTCHGLLKYEYCIQILVVGIFHLTLICL
ncbi:uncharacterized protein RHIMIDRAFT_283552 [Rhizopus microsporus ATCC 52813]|uniref:Transposase n=1 Tax=Rhizopus microsporus ATCC 52813 TaxID=1340429 RepID=A0A2G4SVQ7_RHIZD|nr:uncharacterized protein RHIMIDRAFT_283552 [Rhizopus microsporus ATCC 52813]PHZ12824.1 hypothetical protein RHIMIDRAFT_283552 [Rhizopus microsporus ATCC 52813]